MRDGITSRRKFTTASFFVQQQFVNPAYTVTAERERERGQDREVCTSFTVMQRIERNISSARRGDNQNETENKTELN